MKWKMNKKVKIILACIFAAILLFGIYIAYVMNSLTFIGNTKIPNMTIEIKNNSDTDVKYSIYIEGQNAVNGNLAKNKKSEIKVVYSWNLSDKLEIKIYDKDGKFICESRPELTIKPQHLYNPNIKYRLEAIFKNNQVDVVQVE